MMEVKKPVFGVFTGVFMEEKGFFSRETRTAF